MAGKIDTWEKCSCGRKFEEKLVKIGNKGMVDLRCPVCNTHPGSYRIFLYLDKSICPDERQDRRQYISKNKDGRIIRSCVEANEILTGIRSDIRNGTFFLANYLPEEIEAFRGITLFPKWLETKRDTAPTTFREYDRYIRTYFLPELGRLDMRDIKTAHVEDFLQNLPQHLSLKTKKNILIALHNFCSWLYRRETIAKIPVFPKVSPPDPVIECISRSAQERVLEHLKAHPIFSFMVYHPVRPGEARALRRKHFDLDVMTVHIAEAFSLKELRSRKSKKDYYLPISAKFDVSLLKGKFPEAFVFVNQAGRPYKAENLRRIWHRACKKAGVPPIALYNGCRHSTATDMLQKAGGNLNLVSKALGHSSTKMTEKYAKHNVEILRELMNDNVIPVTQRVLKEGVK
jgi:integrase/recombinase XerD